MRRLVNWAATALLSLGICLTPVNAEDIDIYVGSAGADSSLPNVIFVLDNTSNWSRQAQKWPDGNTQGQSEVKAIKAALQKMTDKVNVGLVEFTTQGNANQDGGYVRFNLQKLSSDSQTSLGSVLDKIFNNINDPTEKRNSNTSYGNLMYDVYNYLSGGAQSYIGAGTPSTLADANAYSSPYSKFKSPLGSNSLCANTYLIFIGNPDSNGPEDDSVANSSALKGLYSGLGVSPDGLYGDSGKVPLPIPGFSVVSSTEGVQTLLGLSSQCYSTNGNNSEVELCSTNEGATGLCVNRENCVCVDNNSASKCSGSGNTAKLQVFQNPTTVTQVTTNGSADTTSGRSWNFDDWAKFMHDYGIPVSYKDSAGATQQQRVSVVTYTIDVFNKQQNAEQTGLMLSAASVSGGRYFAARSETAIVSAITSALSDILSVSATFAAVTLPLSATNRAQQENQVFIGMFRPDKKASPRWFGNLKRYQIGLFSGQSELADVNHDRAINPISGFATECAKSFWTKDSLNYWSGLGIDPPPRSQCTDPSNSYSMWSDLPDGPFVEKGGVAQVTRNSVLANRKVLTVDTTASTGLSKLATITGDTNNVWLNYLKGQVGGYDEKMPETGGRPSIHGDVIHSRPLTINYGGNTGTYVYYGANDGLFRAVAADSGQEQWSLLAPEHASKIKRLYDNQPLVQFPNQDSTAKPKDYFFDGSIGQIVRYNNSNEVSQAYIYPSMRRGGRMVYALDVTTPSDPKLLWRFGCPNLKNDDNCLGDYKSIGQTWSTPVGGDVVVTVTGTVVKPVVMFGGGYDDSCLDSDVANYPCDTSAKGKGIYILDAAAGTVLRTLPTDAPVVAELASVDMNFDGKVDFAYAADAAGSLYRINFSTLNTDSLPTPLGQNDWSITKVANTNTLDKTRRFLNQPTVAVFNSKVYVALGSGNRERPLESNYPYVKSVQDRFYVYVDKPGESQDSPLDLDGGQLADVTASGTTTGSCITTGTRGWFINLKGRGEQVVNPAAIAGGDILFNSYRPGGDSPGLCSRALGVATAYQVSLFNPSSCDSNRSTEIVGGGIPIPPIVATVPATDGEEGGEEKVVTVCIGCEGLKVKEIEASPKQTRRRIYWSSDIDR